MSDWNTVRVLSGGHVRLEPLQASHAAGLRGAVADGELWALWYASVPLPTAVESYIDAALAMQAEGRALPFAVRDAHGDIVGSTRCYDLDPATPRLQIGYTWYAQRTQRTALNTEAKLLLLTHAFQTLGCIRSVSRPAPATTPRAPRSRGWGRSRTASCATTGATPTAACATRLHSRSSMPNGRR